MAIFHLLLFFQYEESHKMPPKKYKTDAEKKAADALRKRNAR